MDIRDMIRLLQEEMELLETALDEAAEQLSKKLGVYVVDELQPITAYIVRTYEAERRAY